MSDLNEIERGQLCQSTILSLYGATGGLKYFPALLKKIISERAWERREAHGKLVELSSLRELITEKPPRGWGENPDTVQKLLHDHPQVLAAYREAMKGQPGRPRNGCESQHISTSKGTGDRAYSLSRVQRECDAPTVAAVMAGEMSPNAALVKAGVRENRQVYLPRDPAQAVDKIRRVFGEEFIGSLTVVLIADQQAKNRR